MVSAYAPLEYHMTGKFPGLGFTSSLFDDELSDGVDSATLVATVARSKMATIMQPNLEIAFVDI